jgi:hypothetical protein
MPPLVALHYGLAFGLELVLLFGFGLFGFRVAGGGWGGGALAVVLVAIAVLLWARFAAPKSATRLGGLPLAVFKIAIFAAGTLAFWAAGWAEIAIAFGLLAALDLGLAGALQQL